MFRDQPDDGLVQREPLVGNLNVTWFGNKVLDGFCERLVKSGLVRRDHCFPGRG